MTDNVNHPEHYTKSSIECIDAILAATEGLPGPEAVLAGNVIKYVWRYQHKGGTEDLRKAVWYLSRLIRLREDGKHGADRHEPAGEL